MGMYKMKYGTSRKAVYFMYGLFGVTFQYTCYLAATGQIKPLDEEEKNKNIILDTFNKYMSRDSVPAITGPATGAGAGTGAVVVPPPAATPRGPSIDSAEFRKSTTK
mmetsp:Transcript_17911/g.29955  ORF Transcript_17911/g.29955 Transcript_17911/m.29955 type:complete len:107 (+) Transcript_17911:143-463(+)